MRRKIETIDAAIEIFAEGGRLHHRGMFFRNEKMTIDGLKKSTEGVDFIDQHSPSARDVLIPLLSTKEESVRVTAASALVASRPDLALPVLYHLRDYCVGEASVSAMLILNFADVFHEFVATLCRNDPRYPSPVPAKEKIIPVGKS